MQQLTLRKIARENVSLCETMRALSAEVCKEKCVRYECAIETANACIAMR